MRKLLALIVVVAMPLWADTAPPAQSNGPLTRIQSASNGKTKEKKPKVTQKDRKAAAARAAAAGLALPAMGTAMMAEPGQAPHYFSHPNYANSPLPTIVTTVGSPATIGNVLSARQYATDESTNVFVVLPAALPTGVLKSFDTFNQANPGSSSGPSAGRSFHGYVLRPTATPGQLEVVFDSGLLTVPATLDPVGEVQTFLVPDISVQAGDLIAFFGSGIPLDIGTGSDGVSYPVAEGPLQGSTIALGSGGFPTLPQARTYSFAASVIDMTQAGVTIAGGIHKFVDGLPGLGAGGANNLGQFIPVAVADTTTYPGSDHYEIAIVQYREKMHTDLPPTLQRGYVQLATAVVPGAEPLSNALLDGTSAPITGYVGVTAPHYLGPLIVATKGRPVRITFRNLLPQGVDGDLFLPVDTTVMGSGMGPNMGGMSEPNPLTPMCGEGYDPISGDRMAKNADCYAENRATLHLHGGLTPWISDGTPHQWITPAGENTNYPQGVSVQNVPDMGNNCNAPNDGCQTFYYTNEQSARLMFYHDHAWGITRLNVYAGEAAGYVITDGTEAQLVAANLIPAAESTIPLVIQDKTFVPDVDQLAVSDNTWDSVRWGTMGNLWLPHVYSPAQNPGDSSGVNQFGRWAYGPWFWPPTSNILHGPVTNQHYDPACDPDVQWCEPQYMPGTPFNSMGMEAFHDTPIVNGTAYPTVTLEPKTYRLRILNAAGDRFFNLSLYKADPQAPTEVQLNPAEVEAALSDSTVFPTPVSGTEGPNWIQIGTEGGFLPSPVVIPAHPITWVADPTVFNAGNVDLHSLLLGPAERADVIVDFSQYAGQTLILYNDAPAAFPARDPRYDYYTGNGDYRDTGGAPSTMPGYGPNTRTVMQIKIADAPPAAAFEVQPLVNAFKATALGGLGIFETGQHPIIVGQGAYNSAYGTSFPNSGNFDGFARISDFSLTFHTLSGVDMNNFPFQSKAIQDEMGEAFDSEYGRMSGNLGLEVPLTGAGTQQNLILYPYVNPASELIDGTLLPKSESEAMMPLAVANDGTQIWKITHNGVDTHPIHFHLFDVQLVNRVGWDGIIRPPEANELGWKDTVRISPLEDTIVALRPMVPAVPFDLPNSVRPLNPMMPLGSPVGFNSTDAFGNPTSPVLNSMVNFGWEYVWHCHILSHEEMDMMRPMSLAVPPRAPVLADPVISGSGSKTQVDLTWTDNSQNETGFAVQRALSANGPWTLLRTVPENTTTYADVIGKSADAYFYQVLAVNEVGYSGVVGYSTLSAKSSSNIVLVGTAAAQPPAAPSNLTATPASGPQVTLTWNDNSTDETGFIVERALGAGAFAVLVTVGPGSGTTATFIDISVAAGNTYTYRIAAVNGAGQSTYTNTAAASTASAPGAPATVTVTAEVQSKKGVINVSWTDVADETGYTIQFATDAGFTSHVSTASVGANITTYQAKGMNRATQYFVRVGAYNLSGQSGWTNATPFPITTP